MGGLFAQKTLVFNRKVTKPMTFHTLVTGKEPIGRADAQG
jgi:hypothetical protein